MSIIEMLDLFRFIIFLVTGVSLLQLFQFIFKLIPVKFRTLKCSLAFVPVFILALFALLNISVPHKETYELTTNDDGSFYEISALLNEGTSNELAVLDVFTDTEQLMLYPQSQWEISLYATSSENAYLEAFTNYSLLTGIFDDKVSINLCLPEKDAKEVEKLWKNSEFFNSYLEIHF